MKNAYNRKNVLITGGLGFIGSNLAIELVKLGARVTVVDVLWPEHGGNFFNIEPVKNDLQVNVSDVRDRQGMELLVKGKDHIFHLAGQCSHVLGQSDPYPDIEINIKGTTSLMEACKSFKRDAQIVYTSTRGVYGSCKTLPVNEETRPNPKGLYEISNLAAEHINLFYANTCGMHVVNLRLSNIYGERSQMKHSKFGVVNWFVRKALDSDKITLYGDGEILRDFLYVEDCVEAILLAGADERSFGNVFNVGSGTPHSFKELAAEIVEGSGSGSIEFAAFPEDRLKQEPGDFYPDISKARNILGWQPKTGLKEGLRRTIEYYKQHKKYYW
ncbi:MAG: GDP-mannose 4,6-dehydratase [Candidatus Eisenbacteria bacterium]|nr:GDP-mannose 4,6-dehydratase [Candidatus Eisenbacteria bacterium]